MRNLLAVVLLPFTLSSFARAQEAPPAAPPAQVAPAAPSQPRLVGVILSSSQALLWDEVKGEYLLKRMGDDLNGARIVGMDQDRVTLERDGAREVLNLVAAPTSKSARKAKRMPAMIVGAAAGENAADAPLGAFAAEATAEHPAPAAPSEVPAPAAQPVAPAPGAQPVAPTPGAIAAAPAAPAPNAPTALVAVATLPAVALAPASVAVAPSASVLPAVAVAPVTGSAPPAAASVPATPPAIAAAAPAVPVQPVVPATPVAPAPVAPAPVASVPVAPPVPTQPAPPTAPPTPAAAPVVVHGPPPSPDSPVVVISRNVLDRELGDFASLADQVTLAQGPRGGFRLVNIRSGSFVERIGLRAGDVLLRVDNRPINAVEDASAAYAWLRVTDHFTVDLVREGRPVKLRYVVTPTQTAQN